MPLYRTILSKAWKISWNNKYLWFFGLFAALLGGGGEYNILFKIMSGDTSQTAFSGWQRIAETGLFSGHTLTNIGKIMKDDPLSLLIILTVFLIILVLGAFLVWLSVISQAALVNNSAEHLAGKRSSFKGGMMKAKEKFWPVLSLNIFLKLLIYLIFILISLPALFSIFNISSWPIFIIFLVIFIPISLAVSFVVKYAIVYAVLKDNNFIESIRSGWQLFAKNWLVSIEMAFLLFLINFFVGLLIVLAVLTLTIPFIFLAAAFYKIASLAGFWLIMVLGSIFLLAFIFFSGAILSTFQISSWTGLFIHLTSKGGTSKIVRIAQGIREIKS